MTHFASNAGRKKILLPSPLSADSLIGPSWESLIENGAEIKEKTKNTEKVAIHYPWIQSHLLRLLKVLINSVLSLYLNLPFCCL